MQVSLCLSEVKKDNMFTKAGKVAGMRQVVRGIKANRIRCVLVAQDADEHIKTEITALCAANSIAVEQVQSKKELGENMGLDVDCAVVGILKDEITG